MGLPRIVAAPPISLFSYQGRCSRIGNVAKAKATFRCVLDAYFVDSEVEVLPGLDSNQNYLIKKIGIARFSPYYCVPLFSICKRFMPRPR